MGTLQELNEHHPNFCDCRKCKEWRQRIYDSGRWPRPRLYNGEVPASRDAVGLDPGLNPVVTLAPAVVDIPKREGELKSEFFAELRRQCPGFLVFQYLTGGAPDRSIIGVGKQTNWEFKHGTPGFDCPGNQALCCARIAGAGHCRFVIWHERHGMQRTLIVHPNVIYRRCTNPSQYLEAEESCVGFDHHWLVKQIRKAHGV